MFFVLLSLVSVAAAITCHDQNALVVTSNTSVTCVECSLLGHLDTSGACICHNESTDPTCRTISDIPLPTVSDCGPDFCRDDDDQCVYSAHGARCRECGAAGFINGSQCTCYAFNADPFAQCAVLVNPMSIKHVDVNETVAYCIPYASKRLGFYASPYACIPGLGPPPNQGTFAHSLCPVHANAQVAPSVAPSLTLRIIGPGMQYIWRSRSKKAK
jgi:hypothetical protein